MPQDRLAPRPATITDFTDLRRPRVIAHRGFSGLYPENTLIAFDKALALGVDMIELDVLLSRDGALVVIHDDTLDRTTPGSGPVAAKDLAELEDLDAGSWFASEFRSERLPTLDDVFELVGDRSLINVEIKSGAIGDRIEGGIVDKVIGLVRQRELRERVMLSCFDPRALHQAREIDPGIARATLFNSDLHGDKSPTEILAEVGSISFNLSRRQVNERVVDECHERGCLVLVYTVNGRDEMRRMIGLGVDGLFTDRPDLMIELLAS